MFDSPETQFVLLLMRDGSCCYLCGQEFEKDDPPEIEHVVPRAARGSDSLENKRLAHRSCNRSKGTHAVVVGPL